MQRIAGILDILSVLYPKTSRSLKVIGMLIVAKKIVSLLVSLYKCMLRRRRNFAKRYGKNSWALVTGSSDGIGKAIALSLAKQGFNIILSARTQFKLDMTRIQLRRAYPNIDIKVLMVDYSHSNQPLYLQKQMLQLEQLDISILVNNVGVDVLDYYHKLTEQQIIKLININCFSVSIMNRIFIPRFLERNRNKGVRSAIVNVSSMAAELPMPLHNIYSASKAFVDYLSRTLSYEYKQSIDVMCLRPSQVSTSMTNHKQLDIMTITPQTCAEGMVNDLGYETTTNGYWNHGLQGAFYRHVPECVFNYVWVNLLAPDFMKDRQIVRRR